MMHKKLTTIISLLCAGILICACGAEVPEVSEENYELIADYAAALLLKYDTNSTSRLLPEGSGTSLTIIPTGNVYAEPSEADKQEPEVSFDDVTVNDVNGNTSSGSGNSSMTNGFADYVGNEIDITYSGEYEVVDSYSEDENAYFTMDASDGNKLLVLHFCLTNLSTEVLSVDMNQYGLKYRVSVNGGSNKIVLTTMMSNDIVSYKGELEAGAQSNIVAVVEISEEEATNISSIDFTIRGDNGKQVMKLL